MKAFSYMVLIYVILIKGATLEEFEGRLEARVLVKKLKECEVI